MLFVKRISTRSLVLSLLVSLILFANVSYADFVDRSIPNMSEFDKVYAFLLDGENLYAGTYGHGIYLSTDYGQNWIEKNNGLGVNDKLIRSIMKYGSDIYIGTEGTGVFKSADGGENWVAAGTGLPNGAEVVNLASLGTNIFAACKGGGLFKSTDNGSNWSEMTNGFGGEKDFRGIKAVGTMLVTGNDDDGFFNSSDDGANWTAVNTGLDGNYLRCKGAMFVSGSTLYAGTKTGLITSVDYGVNWTLLGEEGLTDDDIRAVYVSGSTIFVGTDIAGLFSTSDNGENWTALSGCGVEVRSLLVCSAGLLVGSEAGGGWLDASVTVGVEESNNNIPSSYSLKQNYPNPFNPVTKIEYELMENNFVNIKVFDIQGKEITTLVNTFQEAGNHSVNFSGKSIAGGIYYYSLRVGNMKTTKKMVLIK